MYETDSHGGNIALPGGKLEKGEDAYQAVIREVYEEVGVDLVEQNCLYLGGFEESYINNSSLTRSKEMMINVFGRFYSAFLNTSPDPVEVYYNRDEVDSYRWVSFGNFVDRTSEMFVRYEYTPRIWNWTGYSRLWFTDVSIKGELCGFMLPKFPLRFHSAGDP